MKYSEILKKSFVEAYKHGKDNWSSELEMSMACNYTLNQIKGASRKSVLDLGCGRGHLTEAFASNFKCVTGIDLIFQKEWELVKSRCSNVDFMSGDFFDAKIEKKFDVIFDNGCFHHQDEDLRIDYLLKVKSLMAKSAVLFLNVAFADNIKFKEEVVSGADGRIVHFYTENSIVDLVSKCGFELISSEIVPRKLREMKYLYVWFKSRDEL